MRALLAATIFCALIFAVPVTAEASYRHHHKHHWRAHSGCFLAHCDRCLIYGRHGQCYQHFSRSHLRRHYARVHDPRTGRGIRHVDFSYHTVGAKKSTLHGLMRLADSQGGHCGLWTEWTLLGRVEHVIRDALGTWNPWLADDWSRHYPHVAAANAAPGMAAIWPGRHVAPVVSRPHADGTITVHDSWRVHRVRMAGLVFVQPPSQRRRELLRWPSGALS